MSRKKKKKEPESVKQIKKMERELDKARKGLDRRYKISIDYD